MKSHEYHPSDFAEKFAVHGKGLTKEFILGYFQGFAQGMARSLLIVLRARGFAVKEADRERILAERSGAAEALAGKGRRRRFGHCGPRRAELKPQSISPNLALAPSPPGPVARLNFTTLFRRAGAFAGGAGSRCRDRLFGRYAEGEIESRPREGLKASVGHALGDQGNPSS